MNVVGRMSRKLSPAGSSAELLAELLLLRPDIERIVGGGQRVGDASSDRVQTVILKAFSKLHTYRESGESFKSWVAKIARNVKLDAIRMRERRDEVLCQETGQADRTSAPGASPERATQVGTLWINVMNVIAEMPEGPRDVLVLVVILGLSHEEAAAQLGITETAAKMRLSRARAYLHERVGDIDDHLGAVLPVLVVPNDDGKRGSLSRRAFPFTWQVAHLWGPLVFASLALPHVEHMKANTASAYLEPFVAAANAVIPDANAPTNTSPTNLLVDEPTTVTVVEERRGNTAPNVQLHGSRLRNRAKSTVKPRTSAFQITIDEGDHFVGDRM